MGTHFFYALFSQDLFWMHYKGHIFLSTWNKSFLPSLFSLPPENGRRIHFELPFSTIETSNAHSKMNEINELVRLSEWGVVWNAHIVDVSHGMCVCVLPLKLVHGKSTLNCIYYVFGWLQQYWMMNAKSVSFSMGPHNIRTLEIYIPLAV